MGNLTLTDFVPVVGEDPHSLQVTYIVTREITKGKEYAFRYRAINTIGPGPWSDTAQLKAATVPQAPPKPGFVSATDNSVTISLNPTPENGGSMIIQYVLMRDGGDLSTGIDIKVDDYDGSSQLFTITGLTAGMKYRFDYKAENDIGSSENSDTLTVAATLLPDPPINIVIDWTQSSKTSLLV